MLNLLVPYLFVWLCDVLDEEGVLALGSVVVRGKGWGVKGGGTRDPCFKNLKSPILLSSWSPVWVPPSVVPKVSGGL